MQNKTGKENNVQLLGAGGVLRELHCSTSSHGAQETQDRAALAGGGCWGQAQGQREYLGMKCDWLLKMSLFLAKSLV